MKRFYAIEVLGAESRLSGAFTRGNVLEPYPAECIAGAAEAAGWNAKVLQIGDMTDEEVVADVTGFGAKVVGMTVFTYSLSHAQALATAIKAADPSITIVVGGYHPSMVPECVEYRDFDFAVIGEGEITVMELLGQIEGERDFANVAGIAFVQGGKVVRTSPRERVADLDTLPKPKRVQQYLNSARQHGLSYPAVSEQQAVAEIGFSRGCPNACKFCVSNVQWVERHGIDRATQPCVSYRSPQSAVEEIGELHEQYGVRHLYLTDLTFNQDRQRVFDICQEMIKGGLHDVSTESHSSHIAGSVHWYALVKVGIDDEMARVMASAGCSKVGMGVESFRSARTKDWVKPYKGTEILKQSLEATDRYGIINRCLLVFGAPDETRETVEETIEGLKQFPVDQIRASFLTPFPGTRIAEVIRGSSDLAQYDTEQPVVRVDAMSKQELVDARRYIGTAFYGSREYKARCAEKVRRFPHLAKSYRQWAEYLLAQRIADIREAVR